MTWCLSSKSEGLERRAVGERVDSWDSRCKILFSFLIIRYGQATGSKESSLSGIEIERSTKRTT